MDDWLAVDGLSTVYRCVLNVSFVPEEEETATGQNRTEQNRKRDVETRRKGRELFSDPIPFPPSVDVPLTLGLCHFLAA